MNYWEKLRIFLRTYVNADFFSALDTVSLNLEMICYGTKYSKGTKALAHYIHTEGYKEIEGPFTDWPASLLQELILALYRCCSMCNIGIIITFVKK